MAKFVKKVSVSKKYELVRDADGRYIMWEVDWEINPESGCRSIADMSEVKGHPDYEISKKVLRSNWKYYKDL